MEHNNPAKTTRKEYYNAVNTMGKKEFTLIKMQEYGFWPDHLPTPYEKQKNESREDYENRKKLLDDCNKIAEQIADLYGEKDEISKQLSKLRKEYNQTWDYEKIRKDVAQKIMQESIARRAERKEQKELEKQKRTEAWKKQKAENIVYIGKGYSGLLQDKETDEELLTSLELPIIKDDKELADFLEIPYIDLRFLAYHRDVTLTDHYHRYTIPKRSGGERNIAAPKPLLKSVQKKILEKILEKINISEEAHGFRKGRSVVSGAEVHSKQPELLINIDIENFFPTVTFERVRGLFKSFGYSGYIASLLAMLCTYCERMPIEIKGQTKYVKTSERILPQGSPASPMITNIICRKLDSKLRELAELYQFTYSRYADDMSFSFKESLEQKQIGKILYEIECRVKEEGFEINREKTHYLKKNNRQCITGIVINNEEIGVPKVWLKKMRAAIYNANKAKEKGTLTQHTINEITGMTSWLISVNRDRYKKIINDARKLLNDL